MCPHPLHIEPPIDHPMSFYLFAGGADPGVSLHCPTIHLPCASHHLSTDSLRWPHASSRVSGGVLISPGRQCGDERACQTLRPPLQTGPFSSRSAHRRRHRPVGWDTRPSQSGTMRLRRTSSGSFWDRRCSCRSWVFPTQTTRQNLACQHRKVATPWDWVAILGSP